MRGTFPIGRVLGIPILVNPSWFLSLFLVVWLFSQPGDPYPSMPHAAGGNWLFGLACGLVFFLSIILHELGHCLVARHYSIAVRSITLFMFGGVSQITTEPPSPRAEFLMAFAGPVVSLVLGGALLAAWFVMRAVGTPVVYALGLLGALNITLGVFNLLPGFPLDGGRILRAVIWRVSGNLPVATRLAAMLGRAFAVLLVVFGVLQILGVPVLPVEGSSIGGLWWILVGMFLNNAAGQTQRQARLLNFLRTYRADQLMQADVPQVSADATVRTFVYDLPNAPDDVAYFVTRDGRVAGLLLRDRLRQVPAAQWGTVTAGDLMLPADQILPASPEDDGATLLQRMDTLGLPGLPVVIQGTVAGLVTRAALFRLLRRNPRLRLSRL